MAKRRKQPAPEAPDDATPEPAAKSAKRKDQAVHQLGGGAHEARDGQAVVTSR